MTGAQHLSSAFAALSAQWPFWIVLLATLGAITACSMQCFSKRWLRASICGAWAFIGAMAMCGGLV